MPIEFANRTIRSRTGVKPPSPAEYALAKRQGFDTISGEQLAQMRSQARAAKVAVPVISTVTSDATTIKKLRRQVEKLSNENAILKIRIMTAK